MKIKEILVNCNLLEIEGEKDLDILDISFDSRKVNEGTLFFAVKGTQVDGHDYIDKAIEKGASAIVCEKMPKTKAENVTYFQVDNSAHVLGVAASNFFGNPSEKLRLVGVTGTNGKTTIATLLYRLFTDAGYSCGLLSTIENIINREVIPSTHTTPDPIELNTLLQKMVEQGCEFTIWTTTRRWPTTATPRRNSLTACRNRPSPSPTWTTRTARSCCKTREPKN